MFISRAMIDLLPQIQQWARKCNNPYICVSAAESTTAPLPDELVSLYAACGVIRAALRRLESAIDARGDADEINGQASGLYAQLNTLRVGGDQHGGTLERIHYNLCAALSTRLNSLMTYQRRREDENETLTRVKQRLLNPNATLDELQQQQQLTLNTESLNYVSQRHSEMLQLERDLREVHGLFVDMAALVDEQNELINRAAYHIYNARVDIVDTCAVLVEAHRIKRRTCQIQ